VDRPDAHRGHEARCQICGERHAIRLKPGIVVRPAVAEIIRNDFPNFDADGWICQADLAKYRYRYVESLLQTEKGEIDELDKEVLRSLEEHDILSTNPEEEFQAELTRGERLSDRIASFGGSWTFITIFGGVIVVWMGVNTFFLITRAFDPYPYILLNLVLSCLAAIQAPVIMMSQNRQEARDRLRAIRDYQINLKAELEIRHLHQKVDHLLSNQWERLVEIQEIQMELINELRGRR
jgi:uncharacterized membrane protein